jgi:transposase-like protein
MEDQVRPRAGIDYPRNVQEFDTWFANDASCRDYLCRVRWPQGYTCLRCRSASRPWITARGYMHCRECGAETSVTAGTVFEGTHKPLRVWFQAMWLVTSQKDGVSALGLQRALGLNSYQTAWVWMHKLRRAMVRPGRERLHGTVEVDETYIGGEANWGRRGRGAANKKIVAIAVEMRQPKGFGRIRMRRIPDVSGASLVPFICDVIEPGSTVLTDGWWAYNTVAKKGYEHEKTVISASGDPAHVAMPGVHRVAGLLKRWLLGTHQGAIDGKHLDFYLDEYTFRFNRRASTSRGLLFYRLMQQAVATAAVPYRELVDGDHKI